MKAQRSELGERVRDARQARGWSQARLAREAGVSENTVLNTESGRHTTQGSKRRAILSALGLDDVDRSLDLAGVPDDVVVFIQIVTARLAALDANARARLLASLYPQIIAETPPPQIMGAEDDADVAAAGYRAGRATRSSVKPPS